MSADAPSATSARPGGTLLDGVFVWVWRSDWHGDSIAAGVRRCREHGVRGVLVRAWNGERATAPDGFSFQAQYRAYQELSSSDFTVIPWTYVYGPALGNDPAREADSFADAMAPFDPPLVIVDIEHEGESREYGGRAGATAHLFDRLCKRFEPERVAFSSYDLPALHSLMAPDGVTPQRRDGLDFHAMVRRSALAIPQVYFAQRATRGAAAIRRMRLDWASYGLELPLRPAIQGYGVSPGEVRKVRALVPGLSLWRYDLIEPPVWRALADGAAVAAADGWAAFRAENQKFLAELGAGADAMRLANRLAGRAGSIPPDLLPDYTRLNAHFAGRG